MTRVAVLMDPAVRRVALPPAELARLRELATEVDGVADADVLLTGWGCPPIDAAMLRCAPRLSAVFHAAGSVKHIVSAEAFARGIVVSSAAAANAEPVAAYTLAMIQLAAKRVLPVAAGYRRRGDYRDRTTDSGIGLPGRTVGVIGASRIGRLVIRGLAGAGCQLLVSDPYLDPGAAEGLGAYAVELDQLVSRSDIVTIHAPLLPQTRHLIDARRLGLMRDGAVLINTARGGLVDTDALVEACRTGRIDAVLDVTDPEPLPVGHPLLALENVVVTTHAAGAMGSEVARLGGFAIDELGRYLAGEPLRGAVTADQLVSIA